MMHTTFPRLYELNFGRIGPMAIIGARSHLIILTGNLCQLQSERCIRSTYHSIAEKLVDMIDMKLMNHGDFLPVYSHRSWFALYRMFGGQLIYSSCSIERMV